MMKKYDSMSEELKRYAEKRILESGIRMVPGHYPIFESKEQVDKWVEMNQWMAERAYKEYLEDDGEDDPD